MPPFTDPILDSLISKSRAIVVAAQRKWEDHKTTVDDINSKLQGIQRERDDFFRFGAEKLADMGVREDVLKVELRREAMRFYESFGRETPEMEGKEEAGMEDGVEDKTVKTAQGEASNAAQDELAKIALNEAENTAQDQAAKSAEGETTRVTQDDTADSEPKSQAMLTPEEEEEDLFESAFGNRAGRPSSDSPGLITPRTTTPACQDDRTRKSRKPPVGSNIAYAAISANYPTVIRSPNNDFWVELRCSSCGGNTSTSNKQKGCYFTGARGFLNHFKLSHASEAGGPLTIIRVVKDCTYRQLSIDEANAILRGNKAYVVPKVRSALPAAETSRKLTGDDKGNLAVVETPSDADQETKRTIKTARKSAPMLGTKRTVHEAFLDDSETEL